MGDKSAIEWTDATWNPLIGCSRTSPGCDNCYAIPTVHRGEAMGTAQHVGLTVKPEGGPLDWTGEVRPVPHLLDLPLRWKRPRLVFVNSLSDLFHDAVTPEVIADIFAVMQLAPAHTFQVLTKRARRMLRVLSDPAFRVLVDAARERIRPGCGDFTWPLPNVWLGVSIESDAYTFRANYLRATPAAVRWISAEPLLGPLGSLNLTGIDWLVAGGESGPKARPMSLDWVRDLRDRCACHCDDVIRCVCTPTPTGTAFLFKQWGEWAPYQALAAPAAPVLMADDDPEDADRWMQRVGKRAAGRRLDGRTWDEFPERAS